MRKIILTLFVFLSVSSIGYAQPTAPVKWEIYSAKDDDVSAMLPKMPLVIDSLVQCDQRRTIKYAAYGDEAVFIVTTVKKEGSAPPFCPRATSFTNESFAQRVDEVSAKMEGVKRSTVTVGEREAIKLSGEGSAFLFINDPKEKRWLELWVEGANDERADVKKFFESARLEANRAGQEIEKGSPVMIGDDVRTDCKIERPITSDEPLTAKNRDKKIPVVRATKYPETPKLLIQPKPSYTDLARRRQVTGTIKMRVTFGAGGSISNIDVVKTLPDGLQERAIESALKLVFLPARKDGKICSMTKDIMYSFMVR